MQLNSFINYLFICLFLLHCAKVQQVYSQSHCQERNESLLEEERYCKKSCTNDADCKGILKRCVCDDVCGMSCFNPNATCNALEQFDNGSIEGNLTFGEIVIYTCNNGYLLEGVRTRRCRSDKMWTGLPPSCYPGCLAQGRIGIALPDQPNESYRLGENMSYVCMTGYDLTGNSNVTCQIGGIWSDPQFVCTRKSCGDPGHPENGYKVGDNNLYGSSIYFHCNVGYELNDEINFRVCGSEGEWQGRIPRCEIVHCPTPIAPEDGSVDGRRIQYEYGNEVRYSCDTGYILVGIAMGRCDENSTWGEIPSCMAGCFSQGRIGNALPYQPNESYRLGENMSYVCMIGYNLTGISNVTCQIGGIWSDPQFVCTRKSCGDPGQPENGYKVGDNNLYGSSIYFYCNVGYELDEEINFRVCDSEGEWQGRIPRCEIVHCPTPIAPEDGSVDGRRIQYKYGNEVRYSCGTGYILVGNPMGRCDENSTWGEIPSCLAGCLAQGRIGIALPDQPNESYRLGENMSYVCMIGYNLTGNSNVTCQIGGIWSDPQFVCTRKSCGDPGQPENGYKVGDNYLYESSIYFHCNVGYELNDEINFRVCGSEGEWQRRIPRCEIVHCPTPIAPEDGSVDGRRIQYEYGNEVRYSCDTGYILVGIAMGRCDENSTWGEIPSCMAGCFSQGRIGNALPDQPNESYRLGENMSYVCMIGYDLTGNSNVTCQIGGIWSDPQFVCTRKSCGDPGQPENGYKVGDNNLYESSIYFHCNVGYELDEEINFRVCDSEGEWQGRIPRCEIVHCPTPIAPEDGSVYGRRIQYEYGNEVRYSCDTGYILVGIAMGRCDENSTWGEMPSCLAMLQTYCTRKLDQVEEGRNCRKLCATNSDCRGPRKRCRCDGACGMSCFNPLAECPVLRNITNGRVSYTLQQRRWKNIAEYECDEGFSLRGVSLRTCQSDKKWSGEEPFCSNLNQCGQSINVGGVKEQISVLTRVVDGSDAKVGAWPWQAVIAFDDGNIFTTFERGLHGGGSLINEHWILTAAHVILNLESDDLFLDYTIVALGISELPNERSRRTSSIKMYRPRFVIKHPKYAKSSLFDYDVALIRIGREVIVDGDLLMTSSEQSGGSVTFTEYIRPICLPCTGTCVTPDDVTDDHGRKIMKGNETPEESCRKEGEWLTGRMSLSKRVETIVTGFGTTIQRDLYNGRRDSLSSKLKQGRLHIQQEHQCQEATGKINEKQRDLFGSDALYIPFTQQMICARSGENDTDVDACQGDSGGPIMREIVNSINGRRCWVQVGLVSFGFGCAHREENYAYPGFYTDISRVFSWINNCKTRLTDSQRNNDLMCEDGIRCRALSIPEGIDAQSTNQPLLEEGFEVEAHTLVMFSCLNEFATLVGNPVVTCLGNGTWSSSYPTSCVSCATISIENGRSFCSRRESVGSTCRHYCDSGYKLVGRNTMTCMLRNDGTAKWSLEQPWCIRIGRTCERRQPPNFAISTSNKPLYSVGESVTYTCSVDSEIMGEAASTCQLDGSWSNGLPTCIKITCESRRVPNFATANSNKSSYFVGESVTYDCIHAYGIVGESSSVCRLDRSWSNDLPTCEKVICENRNVPDFAITNSSKSSFELGDSVTYACMDGYELVGEATSECLSNRSWSNQLPICQGITCERRQPPNFAISTSNKPLYSVGESVTYTCSVDSEIMGEAASTCQLDGSWSNGLPTCIKITCESRRVPNFATANSNKSSYFVGESVTYDCIHAYGIVGESSSVCRLDRSWSNDLPTCEKIICENRNVPDFAITNSSKSSFELGDSVTYACMDGYELVGEATSECLSNRSWSNQLPICQEIICQTRVVPEFATASSNNPSWRLGDSVTYTCMDGYELVGEAASECLMDRSWSNQLPICRDSCPGGYTEWTTFCVKAVSSPARNFNEASADCENDEATLPIIRRREVQEKVISLLPRASASWVGLTDRDQERAFRWVTGGRFDNNEYNNFTDLRRIPDGQDCVMYHPNDRVWYANDCTRSLAYVCMKFKSQFRPFRLTSNDSNSHLSNGVYLPVSGTFYNRLPIYKLVTSDESKTSFVYVSRWIMAGQLVSAWNVYSTVGYNGWLIVQSTAETPQKITEKWTNGRVSEFPGTMASVMTEEYVMA